MRFVLISAFVVMVCTSCRAITDLHVEFPDVVVPAGAGDGFTVTATEIVFRGLCAPCATASRTDRARQLQPTTT